MSSTFFCTNVSSNMELAVHYFLVTQIQRNFRNAHNKFCKFTSHTCPAAQNCVFLLRIFGFFHDGTQQNHLSPVTLQINRCSILGHLYRPFIWNFISCTDFYSMVAAFIFLFSIFRPLCEVPGSHINFFLYIVLLVGTIKLNIGNVFRSFVNNIKMKKIFIASCAILFHRSVSSFIEFILFRFVSDVVPKSV